MHITQSKKSLCRRTARKPNNWNTKKNALDMNKNTKKENTHYNMPISNHMKGYLWGFRTSFTNVIDTLHYGKTMCN